MAIRDVIEQRELIEKHLGSRLKHDYGENPYVEVRVWEIALLMKQACSALLASVEAPHLSDACRHSSDTSHARDRLAEWFETVNQKITDTTGGSQPPSYAELYEDIQHGLLHVGYLLEVASVEAGRSWQPIETAPKDGRQLLLWWPYWIGHRPVFGHWQVNGGWQSIDALEGASEQPTHWMPLPDPPSSAVEAGRSAREP